MLLEEGVGIWIWEYRDIPPKLDAILAAPSGSTTTLARYQQNSKRFARPDAAFRVARYVLSNAPWKKMIMDEDSDAGSVAESNPTAELPKNDSFNFINWLGGVPDDLPHRRTSSLKKQQMTMRDFKVMQRIESNIAPHMTLSSDDDNDEDDSDVSSDDSETHCCYNNRDVP